MITIFGDKGSGNCLKVVFVCSHLGIDYRWVPVDTMRSESRTPEFLARSSAGQVPVVELEDGRHLAQSNAIMFYLAEGSALIPGDAYQRAKMLEWMFWEQYSHEPYVAVCRYQMVYLGWGADQLEPERVTRGNAALDRLEAELIHAQWLAGACVTLADVAVVAYTRWAHEGGFDLRSRPAVQAWVARTESALNVTSVTV